MYVYKIIILCGLLLGSAGLKAQEARCGIDRELRADSTNRNRIITRATMYGVGLTNVFDTYLSPQEYKATSLCKLSSRQTWGTHTTK